MKPLYEYFAEENEYADLDAEGAVERLSRAIRCNTVNYADHSLTDFTGFDQLQNIMRSEYPNVMQNGTFELIGHSVLITIPGSDASLRPCLYMSHQDVVPVVKGTENDWTHGAFSGDIADGYIWGRGTLDIKNQVFAILEAAEYLLSHGQSFRRTAYLAFGDDEETLNRGALDIANTLQSRGVTLDFLLDEGGGKIESGELYGAPNAVISQINIMEKGYADLELSVKSIGGHSSNPFGGTSLAQLSTAIAQVVSAPFRAKLSPALKGTFEALRPYVTEEPLVSLLENIDENAEAIVQYCLNTKKLFPLVTTTIAPTMIEGGSAACNVMPQNMRAVINFRIAEGDTAQQVYDHCREAVTSEAVELRFLQANDPSATARIDGFGYAALKTCLEHFYPELIFIPSMTVGGTDAHQYEAICDTCLRCSPFMSETADVITGVHGTNERIAIRSYIQGIRALICMMETCNL